MGFEVSDDGIELSSVPLDRASAEDLARTLRAVADPTRIQVLSMLAASPQGATVQTLTDGLGLRQPTVSHHLRIMHDDGLLDRRQDGRKVWYQIAADRRASIIDLLG
ncbi:ArsR/SmtB family transcription factor [Microbacterium sp. CJ88]|uniref:ArsR/SmtB family transcription factor n=1 Tax=Microbacterium sp. CJ88 TaxID=3445672 RepID=UPI003F65B500